MELSEDAPVGLGKPHFEKFISVCIKDQKSIDANKKNLIEAYSYLGYLYFVQKNFDCSKAAWNKVMELDANNEKAKTALGDKEIGGAAGICDLLPVAATK
jgi:tetratricopeptide (TPR) repeat protein